jgi:hypothetical protein
MSAASVDPSASYAAEVARLLWPDPWEAPFVTRGRHRRGTANRDAYLFPSRRRPRLLIPADVPASSSMVRRLGAGRSPLAVPVRSLLERSVHSRAFAFARWPMLRVPATEPGADSIETHLAGCFGTEVRVGVLLGTRRVNQKPVLQVFDLDGRIRGFAKVGHNDLTAALVRREAEALATVRAHEPQAFRVPEVLHHGQWCGLEVLVLSPLRTDPRNRVSPAARLDAMREVARLTRVGETVLAGSGFWGRLRADAERLSVEPDGSRLVAAADALERSHGAEQVELGAWHGDWGHWNMGMGGDVLNVWDWERFDADVPVGFDCLHYAAQSVRPGERDERRQEEQFLQSVTRTLSELGVRVDHHDLTVSLYLMEIAVRYADALTFGETPALQRRTAWVLSLLERRLDHPQPALVEGRP